MLTRYYHHPIFVEHLTGPGHPERPERLIAIERILEGETFQLLDRELAPEGELESITRVHPMKFAEAVAKAVPEEGLVRVDGDTIISPNSFKAVMRAVGAATSAVDGVVSGDCKNAFVAARPPGHHAEKTTAMGFCLFNTAAIAARHAQAVHGLERLAIMDWDVHHGNGTQDVFWDDPSVLYCSTHQMPLYPGTGSKDETGAGNIVNAPLSAGDGTGQFREAFETRVLPAIDDFKPDLIIISAGFDAHFRDPLANLQLTDADFDWATGKLMDIATRHCDDRLVSILEGGYDLEGLSVSVKAHVKRLLEG